MAGCKQGFARANGGLFGDINGAVVPEGKRPISVENGQIVLWIVNADDIILNPADVKAFNFKEARRVKDMCSGGGKEYAVDVYDLEMNDGRTAIVRVIKTCYANVNGQMRITDFSRKADQLVGLLKK